MGPAEVAFWSAAALLFYGYAGYPLLVALAARILDRRVRKGPVVTPRVSLLIAAYDEEDAIGERLENALASDYPADALEIVVASDGSTDRTDEIVRAFGSERVRLLSLPRRGKMFALIEAARRARGEILVFSDANTEFEPEAIRMLVRSFRDPEVGGVAGHTSYRTARSDGRTPPGAIESAGRGEDLYWRYDTWLKRQESRTGSVVSAHGGMYAVRRELFRPPEDAAVTDDFAVSTAVVDQGMRLVFEPEARAYEETTGESAREFRRRIRLMTRGLRGVLLRRRLLDPFRHGFYSVAFFSRKVLRRLLPLVLPVLFLASVVLWRESPLYAAAATAQAGFYALAVAGWALRGSALGRRKLFYVPFFYCLANLASTVAVANLLRGRRIERWVPQRREAHADGHPGEAEEDAADDLDREARPADRAGRPFRRAGPAPAPAVIVGLDCATGVQTARILAARGIPVVGIAADVRHPCARTRACEEVVAADTTGPALLDALHELATRRGGPMVLFPCTDLSVLLLARNREDLPPSVRIVLPEADVIEALLDKGRFQALARERGIPVPETRLLRTYDDAVGASWSMAFPCVVKPPVKTTAWKSRTSAKVFKAPTPASLLALYDRFEGVVDGLVVQEWIDGPATDHYTCNCYIGRDGEPRACFTTRKLRQWPAVGGQASLSEECRNDRVREETVRLFGDVGLRGFGYIEMKWDERTGRHLVLEANVGRPTGRSATAEAAGVEFLFTAYRDALDLPLPAARTQLFHGVKWIRLRHDAQAAFHLWRRGSLTVGEWRRSIRGARTYALFSWSDPLPFLADIARAAGKVLTGRVGRNGAPASDTVPGPDRIGSGAEPGAFGSRPRIAARSAAVDFTVSGGVAIRLVGPAPGDVRAVQRVVGPPDRPHHGDPDVLVRYEDALDAPGLRLVQGGRSGYTDDGFFLLRSRAGEVAARLRIGDGEPWTEITCVRGGSGVPLLSPLVDMAALKRGWAPLHASAWVHRGIGVVAAGWDRSGKTGALLAFADRGAAFVGDDRVMVHRLGDRMAGFERPLTIREWHLAQLPDLARRAGPVRRSLSAAGPWLDGLQGRLAVGHGGGGLAARGLNRGIGRLRRRLALEISPTEAFGEDRCPGRGAPDALFLLLSHDDEAIRVQPLDPAEVAVRLSATVRAELEPLVETHLAYRFARPGARWTLLECAHELAVELLDEALGGKPVWAVHHPYPCSLDALYRAMDAVLPARAARRLAAPDRRRKRRRRTRSTSTGSTTTEATVAEPLSADAWSPSASPGPAPRPGRSEGAPESSSNPPPTRS